MAEVLGLVLAIEIPAAVGVLVYTVTEDIVTWFADRRIRAIRDRVQRADRGTHHDPPCRSSQTNASPHPEQ